MTANEWPAPAIPNPETPQKAKMKLWKKLLIGLAAFWLIGTIAGKSGSNSSSSGNTGYVSSENDGTGWVNGNSSTESRTSDTNKPTGNADDCSIWKKDFSECVDKRSHDQMDRYYTSANSCHIEDSNYLNCLNDAYYDSNKP